MESAFDFLRNDAYLPGYMLLVSADYDKEGGLFEFNPKEPPVVRGEILEYLTPRGLHICISQAGYALMEHMVGEGRYGGIDIPALRELTLQGRLKITELYQKFRKEVRLERPIHGRFDISKLRLGGMPVLKLDFDFEDRAIQGNLVSVIAKQRMPQLNQHALRI